MVGVTPVRRCTSPASANFSAVRGGGGSLKELAEAGAGIGEAPGGNLDAELIESFIDTLKAVVLHGAPSRFRMRNSYL